MVQYILTPWRHRRELLEVRRQFFPDGIPGTSGPGGPDDETRPEEKHRAVARVSVWMQRGGCPHLVESTALLTAAILSDAASSSAAATGGGSAGTYAARAAYAAAFSRFVTGLLDGHQDKQRKLSMYSVAKTIGLPATFVELRHQATHEQLPSLAKLRLAARKALEWIWEYYWRQLTDNASPQEGQGSVAVSRGDDSHCREAVLEHLDGGDDEYSRTELIKRWDWDRILRALEGITDDPPSTGVMLKALRMTRGVLLARATEEVEDETMKDAEPTKAGAASEETAGEGDNVSGDGDGTGWSPHVGAWKPKPIGVV